MLFTKRQESELITAIKGRGEIPLKFVYLGEGAHNWDAIAGERTETGGINSMESALLTNKAADFVGVFKGISKINVIDIGCGNGYPGVPIFNELHKRGIAFRYVPVDISAELLDLAEKNVQKMFPDIEIRKFQLDFELGNFSDMTYDLKSDGSSNLLLFLGSTLGNFSDRNRVLTNFRDSMSSDDYLINGVELTNFAKINKILSHYQVDAVKDFLYFIPKQIGINPEDTDFNVVWNDRESQVEIRIIFKKDAFINIGKENFKLEEGESLFVARSIKFTEWSIMKLFSDVGYRNELLTTNADRTFMLSMVQPTRYLV
ncbi:MAG: L-histidine N(alpha)-methyltransferase [Candidatus Paceibacteria bacterium]